ncbi:hypothetical protein U1Q18_031051, partial [Sarracenia purpurea var. burkii]
NSPSPIILLKKKGDLGDLDGGSGSNRGDPQPCLWSGHCSELVVREVLTFQDHFYPLISVSKVPKRLIPLSPDRKQQGPEQVISLSPDQQWQGFQICPSWHCPWASQYKPPNYRRWNSG